MVEHAMRMWRGVKLDQRICVTGHLNDQISELAKGQDWTPHYNSNYLLGPGASIKSAINFMDLSQSNGVIISVCDQPLVPGHYYQRFYEMVQSNPHSIIASKYLQDFGVPSYFPRSCFDELTRIGNTNGAKSIIHSRLSDTKFLYCAQGHRDIDTKYDLQYLAQLEPVTS